MKPLTRNEMIERIALGDSRHSAEICKRIMNYETTKEQFERLEQLIKDSQK